MPRWRITCLLLALSCGVPSLPVGADETVRPGMTLRFPADHGAHPDFRTEWWYVTGWLRTTDQRDVGFQLTFFRTRGTVDDGNPSRFAPRQILFAHAALSDPAIGHLLHDQRIARAGFGLAESAVSDTDLVLDGWRLRRGADGNYAAVVQGDTFDLDLTLQPTQMLLLQGDQGYSRKGPLSDEASYYYSQPHLRVAGSIREGGRALAVTGEAWLDREWSNTLLDPAAVGWDWLGVNLDDGSALTAFQIRDAGGNALWGGGSLRMADGRLTILGRDDVHFTPTRTWHSPRTGSNYPLAPTITLSGPAGERRYSVHPLFDDQELDSRQAGGPVYWEGAVRVDGADASVGQEQGHGYLELTGYFEKLTM